MAIALEFATYADMCGAAEELETELIDVTTDAESLAVYVSVPDFMDNQSLISEICSEYGGRVKR